MKLSSFFDYRYLLLFFLLISLIIFLIWPKWTVDDAFITFRYAKNWVQYGEINWNPGEDPVEGYTNFLWLVLIAAGLKAGVDPVTFTHIAGALIYFLCFVVIYLISRLFSFKKFSLLLLFALLVFNFDLYVHALSGLETILFIFLTLLIFYLASLIVMKLKVENNKQNLYFVLLSVSCLAISLTRPEGLAFSLIVIFYMAYFGLKNQKKMTPLLIVFFAFVLPYAGYFLWRFNYYGQLFPNTYYAKLAQPYDFFEQIKSYVIFMIKIYNAPLALIVLFASWLFFAGKQIKISKEKFKLLIVFLLINVPVVIVYMKSFLVMNYYYRFFYHFGILNMVILFIAADDLLKQFYISRKTSNPTNSVIYLAYAFGFLGVLSLLISFSPKYHFCKATDRYLFSKDYQVLLENEHIRVGKILRNMLPKNSLIACIRDAGAAPYYSELRAVDFGLLNDEYLPKIQRSSKEEIEYFFKKDPDAAIITSTKKDIVFHPINWVGSFGSALVGDKRFKSKYVLYKVFSAKNHEGKEMDYYQFLYVKKSLLLN